MKYLLIISLFLSGCSVVGPGERGVRVTQGKVSDAILDSGWYTYIPFITKVISISIRVQKSEAHTEAASKDLQKVSAKMAINWHVEPSSAAILYQKVGDEDAVKINVIDPAVSETLKAATAKMTAEEVLTKRIELKNNIDEVLVARLKNYNIVVDDISIVDLKFTVGFDHAVEQKQIAKQRAKQADYEAQRAVKEAEAEVNKAKGTAQAQQLLKATITSELLKKQAIEKWDGKFPQVMGSGTLPFLNINDLEKNK